MPVKNEGFFQTIIGHKIQFEIKKDKTSADTSVTSKQGKLIIIGYTQGSTDDFGRVFPTA